MATEPLRFFTTRGRFISGDMNKLDTTDHQRKPLPPEKHQYAFGVAFPKQEIWSLIAEQFYPWLAGQWVNDPDKQQRLQRWMAQPGLKGKMGGLSLKISDGDAPNAKGQVSEYTKGCFVFWFTSFGTGDATKVQVQYPAEPPKLFAGPSTDKLTEIDINTIKRGDYCAVSGTISLNGNDGDNSGVYLNGTMVWLLEQGDAIAGGLDPSDAFGGSNLQGSYDPSQGAGAAFGGATPPPPPQQGYAAPPPPQQGYAAPPPPNPTDAPVPGQTVGAAVPPPSGQTSGVPPQSSASPYSGFMNPPATPELPG